MSNESDAETKQMWRELEAGPAIPESPTPNPCSRGVPTVEFSFDPEMEPTLMRMVRSGKTPVDYVHEESFRVSVRNATLLGRVSGIQEGRAQERESRWIYLALAAVFGAIVGAASLLLIAEMVGVRIAW